MFTRENIITLNLSGDRDTVKCNHCGMIEEIPFEFMPRIMKYETRRKIQQIGRRVTKITKHSELVKTRKRFLWIFQEMHFEDYLRSEENKKKYESERLYKNKKTIKRKA